MTKMINVIVLVARLLTLVLLVFDADGSIIYKKGTLDTEESEPPNIERTKGSQFGYGHRIGLLPAQRKIYLLKKGDSPSPPKVYIVPPVAKVVIRKKPPSPSDKLKLKSDIYYSLPSLTERSKTNGDIQLIKSPSRQRSIQLRKNASVIIIRPENLRKGYNLRIALTGVSKQKENPSKKLSQRRHKAMKKGLSQLRGLGEHASKTPSQRRHEAWKKALSQPRDVKKHISKISLPAGFRGSGKTPSAERPKHIPRHKSTKSNGKSAFSLSQPRGIKKHISKSTLSAKSHGSGKTPSARRHKHILGHKSTKSNGKSAFSLSQPRGINKLYRKYYVPARFLGSGETPSALQHKLIPKHNSTKSNGNSTFALSQPKGVKKQLSKSTVPAKSRGSGKTPSARQHKHIPKHNSTKSNGTSAFALSQPKGVKKQLSKSTVSAKSHGSGETSSARRHKSTKSNGKSAFALSQPKRVNILLNKSTVPARFLGSGETSSARRHKHILRHKSTKSNGKYSTNELRSFIKDLEGKTKDHTRGHVKFVAYASRALPSLKNGYQVICSGLPLVHFMKKEVTKFESIVIEIKGPSDKEPRPLVGIIGDDLVWNNDIEWPHKYEHTPLAHVISSKNLGKAVIRLKVPLDSCNQYDYEISCKVFNLRKDASLAVDESRKINLSKIKCPLYRRKRETKIGKDKVEVVKLSQCTSSADSAIATLEVIIILILIMIVGVMYRNFKLKKLLTYHTKGKIIKAPRQCWNMTELLENHRKIVNKK